VILIRYFIGDVEYASRTREHVPAKHDLIRFNGDGFEITRVLWIEDGDRPEVQITIVEL